jgi:hypothetical protein
MNLHPLIERKLRLLGVKTYPPIMRWYSIQRFSQMFGIPQHKVYQYARNSLTVHGVDNGNQPFMIHPDGANRMVKQKNVAKLNRLIKEDKLREEKSRAELNAMEVSDGIRKSALDTSCA